MSINALTQESLMRSRDYRAAVSRDLERNHERDLNRSVPTTTTTASNTGASNALSMLVKYIPTESITLYVAAISAASSLATLGVTTKIIYWFFGILTPLLTLAIYFGKRRAAKLKAIPKPAEWPWWETVAGTIAFLVWALAIPNNPYIDGPTQGALAGFFALFISTILRVFENLFKSPAES
jgi:hypothetical protein